MYLKCFVYLCLYVVPSILGYRRLKYDGADITFAKLGEKVDIICENEVPLVRCGLSHPNGTKILFVNVVPGTPSCKFTTDVTESEVGIWTCHLWTPASLQEEIQKTVELRVAHKFAALDKEVWVREGETVTLSCVSSEGMFPLKTCYFTSPGNSKIHMDDSMHKEHMVLGKYFFPANRSVHRGDCSVTITLATADDLGSWTCAGWLDLENREYTDTIHLTVYSDTINAGEEFTISVTAYICGSLAFLCLFATLAYCKERYYSQFYGKTWGDDNSIQNYIMMSSLLNTKQSIQHCDLY